MKKTLLFASSLLFACSASVVQISNEVLPKSEPTELKPVSKFNNEMINECSGIVKSRQFDDLYWVLNDSGDDPRIFAVNAKGELYVPTWMEDYKGMYISDAVNIDWEDIAVNDKNQLIIGACGNNGNARKDLAVYLVDEPNPMATYATRYAQKIPFHYPDQTMFPPENRNFDCEAVFTFNGKIHFLSKHRSDTRTKLYRLDNFDTIESNELTMLGSFPINGAVTAADVSPNQKQLVVLTYSGITIFEIENEKQNFFEGKISHLPISAKQCESICFSDDENIVLTNEQMDIYYLKVSEIPAIK